MADCAYRKCVICNISRQDFATFPASDLPFTEGIITAPDNDFISVEETGKRFALALRTALKCLNPNRDLVLNVRSCKESEGKIQQSGANLKIFLSEKLLNKHELHFGETVWVKRVNLSPLEKVVVGFLSEEKYLWGHKSLATFLLNSLSSGPLVVRENESFCLPDDQGKSLAYDKEEGLSVVSILQCEPVSQGCITSETSLVVTKLTVPEILSFSEISETDSLVLPPDSCEKFFVSDFAHDLHGSQPHDQPCNDCVVRRTHQLQVNVLDSKMNSDADVTCDVTSRVFVSLATLIDMQLFNGSWVKISIKSLRAFSDSKLENNSVEEGSSRHGNGLHERSCATSECQCHVVQLLAAASKNEHDNNFIGEDITCVYALANRDELEDGIAYVSPLLYFNLFKKTDDYDLAPVIFISPICDTTQVQDKSSTTSRIFEPSFATEAHIALVHSPQYKAGDSFDGALASYFKVPRMLTVGEIFCVQYDWHDGSNVGKVANSGDKQGWRNLVVYFLVTRLVCETGDAKSCFVDMEHSSLYQRGSVHSYVPAALEPLVCRRMEHHDSRPSYWEQRSLVGLTTYVDILKNIVNPYLNSRGDQSLPSLGILLSGPPGSGKTTVAVATSKRLNLHIFEVNCYELIGESIAGTEARLKNVFQKAIFCSPCILLLQSIHTLGKDKEGNDDEPRIAATVIDCISSLKEASDWPVVVIATSSSPNEITSDMFSCFLHEVKLEAPTESERCDMLCGLAVMASVGNDVSFQQLAKRTAGLMLADFVALFSHATSAAMRRLLGDGDIEKSALAAEASNQSWFSWQLEQELSAMGVKLCMQDFEDGLEILQSSLSDAIGAPKIPSVRWEDVGGLADVKAEILDTVQLPLQHPELFAAGLRRSGVLLYGPPGTGKTLLAKAVATECSLNFLSVKGPELINMYVGQSEQNVREVFSRAQSARPCVIFFDELDSLAPNRGRSGDSGGVMDRVVSQLLAELDGLHKACDVFVIGATNRPDLLDPALLRPGRFDKLLYLGVSEDRESQLNILRAQTRKFSLHPDLRLENIAALCPANLTGADFYALCSDAMLQSVKRRIELQEKGQTDPTADCNDIHVSEEDFQRALEALVPSVSLQELKRYKDLQYQFTQANNFNFKK